MLFYFILASCSVCARTPDLAKLSSGSFLFVKNSSLFLNTRSLAADNRCAQIWMQYACLHSALHICISPGCLQLCSTDCCCPVSPFRYIGSCFANVDFRTHLYHAKYVTSVPYAHRIIVFILSGATGLSAALQLYVAKTRLNQKAFAVCNK